MSVQWKRYLGSLSAICLSVLVLSCSAASSGKASGGAYSGALEDQIIEATQAGDVAAVKALLDQDSGLANAWDQSSEKSVLHYAARHDNSAIVTMLLEKGADPLAKDSDDNIPLECAQQANGSDSVKKLLYDAYKKASTSAQ